MLRAVGDGLLRPVGPGVLSVRRASDWEQVFPTEPSEPVGNASGIDPEQYDAEGWALIFADDFDDDFSIGAVSSEGVFPAPYPSSINAYNDWWNDSAGGQEWSGFHPSIYAPSAVLYAEGSMLKKHLHYPTTGEFADHQVSSAVGIGVPNAQDSSQLYGRYAVCFKVPEGIDPGWKTAWLLWPASDDWPQDGEIDFPEGGLTGTIEAYMHRQDGTSGGDQDGYSTDVPYISEGLGDGWHVCIIEWAAGWCRFELNGVTIGLSRNRVPDTPMFWVLQTESDFHDVPDSFAGPGDEAEIWVDWVRMWELDGFTPPPIGDIDTDFTGSNGDPWPIEFSVDGNATAGDPYPTATIQGNRGRLTMGDDGEYATRIWMRADTAGNDYEATFGVHVHQNSDETYAEYHFRIGDAGNYFVYYAMENGQVGLVVQPWEGGQTTLDTGSASNSVNDVIRFRVRVEGSDIKVRWWTEGSSEPGTWNIEETHSTHAVGPVISLAAGGGNTALSGPYIEFTDFQLVTVD